MLNRMTRLIPKRRRKNGMVRMNSVSEIWDMEISSTEWRTTNDRAYCGNLAKSLRKGDAKALLICRANPSNKEKRKKINIFRLSNSANASSPSEANKVGFGPLRTGKQGGSVKAYIPSASPAA